MTESKCPDPSCGIDTDGPGELGHHIVSNHGLSGGMLGYVSILSEMY
jgi:hypothetical protein